MNAGLTDLARAQSAAPPPPGAAGLIAGVREQSRGRYVFGLVCALLLHAGIFQLLRSGLATGPEYSVSVGDSSVEVTLVAAPAAPEPIADAPVEAVTEPPVEPAPVEPPPPPPVPEEPPPPEAIVEPAPQPVPLPPIAPPKPQPVKPAPAKAAPRKAAPRPIAVGDGSSAVPGRDATTSRAMNGDRAQPGYLRNPHPAYPEEARRAKQEGVVMLRVRVTAEGTVASASITRSSGYPMLDDRALSTVRDRWSFKPARVGGVNIASEVIIPVRFSLRN